MSKKKTKGIWGGYKQYTLTDGTKFYARDDNDAELYRKKVGDVKWNQYIQTQHQSSKGFVNL